MTEIEIVPSLVRIAKDPGHATRFVLEARLWTTLDSKPSGIPESAGVNVSWSISPSDVGLRLDGNPHGYRATLVLDAGKDLTGTVTVTAEAGGLKAESRIMRATASEDFIDAEYVDDIGPGALIVRGMKSGIFCSVWLPAAVTRTGNLGDVTDDCTESGVKWAAALLSSGQAAKIFSQPWTAGVDRVDASAPAAVRTLPLALRVFIKGTGAEQANAKSFTLDELTDVNWVFKDSRAGIEFTPVNVEIIPPPASGAETSIDGCGSGDAKTSSHDYVPPSAPAGTPPLIHLYVLNDLGYNIDAFTCPATSRRPYPVIYLHEGRSGTILLHELGHALALDVPGAGHSDYMDHFDAANVMVSGYVTDNVWRRRFTVGQTFRMNAEGGSWLNWATDLAGQKLRDGTQPRVNCQCGAHDPVGRCPRLVDDLAKPRGSVGTLQPWECNDVVRVATASSDDDPRALIAGRPWRSPLNGCRRDIAGKRLEISGVDWIRLQNITGPGLCHSWVAIFFRAHQPVFSDLANVGGTWGDAADSRQFDPPLSPLSPVTIRVHYLPFDVNKVKAGIKDAKAVYGPENRTGLDLTLIPDLTPCPMAQGGPLSVCYLSLTGATVAQLVGKALGLPGLTAAEQTKPAFAANAFLTGPGRGRKLTLGQVFRIHSRLNAALSAPVWPWPDCAQAPSACPPLEADAP